MEESANWQPPKDVKPIMVCAANRCKDSGAIVLGARHYSKLMSNGINNIRGELRGGRQWEQGFIDQWERFYTRKEAMKAVLENGQPFNLTRNGGRTKRLYSEGLY